VARDWILSCGHLVPMREHERPDEPPRRPRMCPDLQKAAERQRTPAYLKASTSSRLLVINSRSDDLPDVVVAHLRVILVTVLPHLRDEIVVGLAGEVNVFVCFMDAVKRAHRVSSLFRRGSTIAPQGE